ncbi:hypothetical protein HRS9122_04446 [Pyrenophora teres f. teres]|nr:hypothetical protein HRS9122_04446 [Pyrenophora teres f. teres]
MADSNKPPNPSPSSSSASATYVRAPNPLHSHTQTNVQQGRSTMAEGVFQSLTSPSHPLVSAIDSCGTGAYHVGSSPDSRTMSTLRANNITTYRHAARKFSPRTDFDDFDYVLCMDDENLAHVEALRTDEVKRRGAARKASQRNHEQTALELQKSHTHTALEFVLDAQFASFMLLD